MVLLLSCACNAFFNGTGASFFICSSFWPSCWGGGGIALGGAGTAAFIKWEVEGANNGSTLAALFYSVH